VNATIAHTLGHQIFPTMLVSDAHHLLALKIPSFAGCNHPSVPS
jgi:hypothetical protein